MIKPKDRGFTLIELLVVIAIIAILVAILMPVIAGVQEKARQARCGTNMMQMVTALRAYKADFHAYPFRPYFDSTAWVYVGGASSLFPDYLTSKTVLMCPNDASNFRGATNMPANYCSYNGLIHGTADTSFNDMTSANFWRFEAVGGGVGNAGTRCMVTYNYGGFDNNGLDLSYYGATGWTVDSPFGFADPVPAWLTTEGKKRRHWPRLQNRRAPDNTIVARCIHHHGWYGRDESDASPQPETWRDVIVRLGGDNESVDYQPFTAPKIAGASQWMIQD